MSNAIIVMLVVMGGTMLLRAPISFGMLAGGVAYLIVKGQDVGLMAEQVLNPWCRPRGGSSHQPHPARWRVLAARPRP
jgi:hypothetical protein